MATAAEIDRTRDYIAEPNDQNGWTDARIGQYIDEAASLYAAAAEIWSVKAAAYAALVDVAESGSSRSMGSLQAQALIMEKKYREKASEQADSIAGSPFVVPITRKKS